MSIDGDPTVNENTGARAYVGALPSIPGYTIVGELGRGGMGAVFRAHRDKEGDDVALKVITHADELFRDRFAREIEAAMRIPSPHVVRVLAFGLNPPFLATELVDGGALRGLLHKRPLPVSVALRWLDDLLAGLGAAHGEGVVHRDIKPHNLLVGKDGRLKIADFGVARLVDQSSLTSTGGLVGTPAYMSPEQAHGAKADARCDLFAAGLVFYEMIAGEHPFRADSPAATLLRIMKLRHRLASEVHPAVPDDVDALAERFLCARERRLGSAAAARAALAPLLSVLGATRDDCAAIVVDDAKARARLDARLRGAEIMRARKALATRDHDMASATTMKLVRAWPADVDVRALKRDVERGGARVKPSVSALALLKRADDEEAPLLTLKTAARTARDDGDALTERLVHARVLQIAPDDEESGSRLRPILRGSDDVTRELPDVARLVLVLPRALWEWFRMWAEHADSSSIRRVAWLIPPAMLLGVVYWFLAHAHIHAK